MPGYLGEVAKTPVLTARRYRQMARAAAEASGLRVQFRNHPYPRPGRFQGLRRILPCGCGSLYSAEPEGTNLAPFFQHWSQALAEADPSQRPAR